MAVLLLTVSAAIVRLSLKMVYNNAENTPATVAVDVEDIVTVSTASGNEAVEVENVELLPNEEDSLVKRQQFVDEKLPMPVKFEPITPEQIEANKAELDKYFDTGYVYSITRKLLKFLNDHYFRARFVGFDEPIERNNPDHPVILASNHSGMSFPWDGISFMSGLFERMDYKMEYSARALATPMLSAVRYMSLFMIPDFWKRLGGIDANMLNYETAMNHLNCNLLIYPEGIQGIGKGFNRRYQLQRMATSTLRMSIKYKTDIVPFATVNAEYINPFSYSIDKLNEFVHRFNIPFLPISLLVALIPLQPWLFYFSLPVQVTFVKGQRIKPYELLGNRPLEEVTEAEILAVRDQMQTQMQEELDAAVAKYGQSPYNLESLWNALFEQSESMVKAIPLFWPVLFMEHEKQYNRLRKRLESMGLFPAQQEERTEKMKEVYDMETEEEVTVMSVVDKLVKNPEILLMYTPVVGLISMFTKGNK